MSNELSDIRSDSERPPYDLVLETREHYLYACVQADYVDLKIAIHYINHLMGHVRETYHWRVLFVSKTPDTVSEATHSLATSVLITLLPIDTKLAVVHPAPAHVIVKEVIKADRRRRRASIDAFASFEEAETWLLAA